MRSLWRAKSSPSTPSESTSSSTPSQFASSVLASLQSLQSAAAPLPTTSSSKASKTPVSTSSSHRQPQHGFKASLSTPLPTETSTPVIPSTPLPSSVRSPPPAPLNLSKSLPGITSSGPGSSSSVLASSSTPGHRREGSQTQYAHYPPTSVSTLGSAASSNSTPTVPSSSATITFPASTSTLPADPGHQLPQSSPSTPRRKVSMKRLLAKPAPPSPSMSPPNSYTGHSKGSPSGSSPASKSTSESEGRRSGSKSEDESKPRQKRRPSALELEGEPKPTKMKESHGVVDSGSKERSKSQRYTNPNEKDKMVGNDTHTTLTNSASPSLRPPIPGQRQRTSSENSRRDRSQSRSRRDRTNPSTPPSVPSRSATSQRGEASATTHSPHNHLLSPAILPTLSATAVGNQYVGIEYEPPSPSLDFSAAFGRLGLGSHNSSPLVSKEKSRSLPSFEQDVENALTKGNNSASSKHSMPTTSLTNSSIAAQFDHSIPKLDRLLGISMSREPGTSAVAEVETVLAGLGPKREPKVQEEKSRRGRTGLLKKASRKFGSESSLTTSTQNPPSSHPSLFAKSSVPSPLPSSGGGWFALAAPAAMSGGGAISPPPHHVPSPRSRSFCRESPRPSPIRATTEPHSNTRSNPASRSSSVSRDKDAQKQHGAAPSNWKSPTEWMSGPQTGQVHSPPAIASPNVNKPIPPIPPVPSAPFRSDSTPSSRANSPHLFQPLDSRSLKSHPSLPVSTTNSRAPSRLAESTGVMDVQSAITNGLSSSGTGTSSADSPVVFVPMMLMDGNDTGDDGPSARGKAARLSIVAMGDRKDKKKRKEKEKDRQRVGSGPNLTPAASLIEEYKLKEIESERRKSSKTGSISSQRLAKLAKDRRSKSLVGLRDIFFGAGEGSKGHDSTESIPKVELSRFIQPSPQPSHQTTSSRATHVHSRTQGRALLRNSANGLSSSMSDSNLRGSFVAGESVRISGYGGTGPVIRGGGDQIRMMFAGGAVETGEDGRGHISDEDIFELGERDTQPSTPLHGEFGGWAFGRENGVDWSSTFDPLLKEEKKKEGLTQSLGRKVSITRWRRGSASGPTSDEGHGSASGHTSERESRKVEKMQAARRKRVTSARRHDNDDKSHRSLRLSIDKFPEDTDADKLKRTRNEKPRHAHPPKGGKGIWRLVRRLSVSTRDKSLMPPPPVPSLPSGIPPPVPPKKSRSRSRKAATRSSSPISSSDHASSSYRRTHSARSSTSSVYEPPPPLPKPLSALLNAHIIQPGMLDTVHQEPSPQLSSQFVPSPPPKPTTDNNWSATFTRSSDPEIASLTLPPRRTPTKQTAKSPNVVSANTPRPFSMSMTLDRTPHQEFDNESIRSGASGSPIIPTFSTEEPVNAFPKRLSGKLSNKSKASPTTPGSMMTGTNTSTSSPLDVNGEPIPISLQLDSTTFIFPPSALAEGPPPPRPARNSQRLVPSTSSVRPRVYTVDVPVDVMEFGSDSAIGSPTSLFQRYSGESNPAKYLYRKSSGGMGAGNRLRGGGSGSLNHSRKRSSSYGGEGSDHSSPLSQSPVEGYTTSNLPSLPPPPTTSRRASPSASTPPDSFSRFTSQSVIHRPGTANTFGPSTFALERHHDNVMSIFDMHRSTSSSSNPSSTSSIDTAQTPKQDLNSRKNQGRGLSPGTASAPSPIALSASASSLRSSILHDSESYGLLTGVNVVHQAQRVDLTRRSTSERASDAPNILSDREKHDRWEELMNRSDMAGGTLQMSVGLGLGADGL
ncbi:hypothetical protein CPB83DRAFT_852274 [Crepidotus variabilis]|uniref:Uncharacterized protein n=1 Tax=Crepidotus variabilis TaxID=179855 RepID=A0A9P6EIH9_9AGAR|nr:hypothetical protein CPB83DRAFT_852274 [Crepidotus variabilis]